MVKKILNSLFITFFIMCNFFIICYKNVNAQEIHTKPVQIDKQIDSEVDSNLREHHFCGSILIVKNGQIIVDRSYGNSTQTRLNNDNTAYGIDSVQKIITGTLIMKVFNKCHLSLDTKLSKFYPQIENSKNISIRQMLAMTSGLSMDGPVGPTDLVSDNAIINYDLNHVKFDKNYYGSWRYEQVNYNLLAGILMKLTGKSYNALVVNNIIKPLNLKQTFFLPDNNVNISLPFVNNNGIPDFNNVVDNSVAFWHDELGTGRMAMTSKDVYLMISGILQGKIINKSLVNRLFVSGSDSTYGGGTYNMMDAAFNHGLGYGYEAMTCVSKDGKNAVILLSNSAPTGNWSLKYYAENLYEKLFYKK